MADDKKICKRCGKIHVTQRGGTACTAHLTNDPNTPCSRPPIAGGFVCRAHGGALTKTKVAAAQRLALMSAQGEIADLMRECDVPEQHPVDGLLEVVRVSGSMMRLLTIKVGELRENPEVEEVLVEGSQGDLTTKKQASGDAFWGLNHQDEMVPHMYVVLLKSWTERYERACKTALDAGIDERRIRLEESQGDILFTALEAAMKRSGLSPDQVRVFSVAISEELRKLNLPELEGSVVES